MVAPLKKNGIAECAKLRKRVIAQHNLGRIHRTDKEYLVDLLNKVEARIIKMEEKGEEKWL